MVGWSPDQSLPSPREPVAHLLAAKAPPWRGRGPREAATSGLSDLRFRSRVGRRPPPSRVEPAVELHSIVEDPPTHLVVGRARSGNPHFRQRFAEPGANRLRRHSSRANPAYISSRMCRSASCQACTTGRGAVSACPLTRHSPGRRGRTCGDRTTFSTWPPTRYGRVSNARSAASRKRSRCRLTRACSFTHVRGAVWSSGRRRVIVVCSAPMDPCRVRPCRGLEAATTAADRGAHDGSLSPRPPFVAFSQRSLSPPPAVDAESPSVGGKFNPSERIGLPRRRKPVTTSTCHRRQAEPVAE